MRSLSRTARIGTACGLAAALALAAAPAAPADASSRVTWIGAYAGGKPSQWENAYQEIGPLQTDKVFFPETQPRAMLPPKFEGSSCGTLPQDPVCIIVYAQENTNLMSFVQSVPPHRDRPVIMVYDNEPELNKKSQSGKTFTANFEDQSAKITKYATAKGLTDVKVAMDAATSQYANKTGPGSRGYDCAYIPPARYVDYYLADVYQRSHLSGLKYVPGFQRWAECTAANGKPRGIAEYGLDKCNGTTEQDREHTLARDAAYLAKNFANLVIWNYWWADTHSGACHDPEFPVKSPTATEWRKIEAGTVPS